MGYNICVREKIDNIINGRVGRLIDGLFNSQFYPYVAAAVSIFAHCLDLPVLGVFLHAILLCVSFIFCKNTLVIVPFALLCPFVMSENTMPDIGYYNTPFRISSLVLCLAFAVAAFSFNLIYYGKWKVIFKKAYLTVSLSLMSGALVLGGLFSEDFCLTGVLISLAIAVCVFLPYSMLVNSADYKGKESVKYFANISVAAAITVGTFVLQQYCLHDFVTDPVAVKGFLKLGAVGPNTGAAIMLIALPMTFYLIYVYKYGFLYYILLVAEVFAMIMTYSRAALVVAIPGTVLVSFILCFKNKTGKLGYWITFGILMSVALAFTITYKETVVKTVLSLFEDGSDSGRIELWAVGFENWKKHPIFGLGMWFLPRHGNWYYSFHCTPLTYLYSGGLVGFIAYAYHRYKTVRLVFTAKLNSKRVFLALAVLATLLNALLDLGMTNPFHLLYYSTMIGLIECDARAVSGAGGNTALNKSNDAVATPRENSEGF